MNEHKLCLLPTFMKEKTIEHKGEKIDILCFSVPALHDDFHIAEKKGMVYAGYLHNGPNFWDDWMVFCAKENVNKIIEWNGSTKL